MSFNVNGLRLADKRSIIFNKLKQLNTIAFLQETHCTKYDDKAWKDKWNCKSYLSNGTRNRKCVSILFPPNLNIKLCKKRSDNEGRLLLLTIKIQSNVYVWCNIYTATQDHKMDQNSFIANIKEELAPFANESILLGGDFNFYMDPKLDTMGCMPCRNNNPIYRKEINAILESMNLTDCFRNIYPTLKRYTWHSRSNS